MKTTPSGLDAAVCICVDVSMKKQGGPVDLQTPAGPMTMLLPPGLQDGQTLHVIGRGELGPDGKRGDVLLTVTFFSSAHSSESLALKDVPAVIHGPASAQGGSENGKDTGHVDAESEVEAKVQATTAPPERTPQTNRTPAISKRRASNQEQKTPAHSSKPKTPRPTSTPATSRVPVAKAVDDTSENSNRGVILMAIVAAGAVLFLLYQKKTLVDPYVSARTSGTLQVQHTENQAKPRTVSESVDYTTSLAGWKQEKEQMLQDALAKTGGNLPTLSNTPDPENAEQSDPQELIIVNEEAYLRERRMYEKFTKSSDVPGDPALARLLGPKPTYVNITRRMGVDADSLSGISRELSVERFLSVIHSLFFDRPFSRGIRERLSVKNDLLGSTRPPLGQLNVIIQGSYLEGSETVPFEALFREEDARDMTNWEFMDEMQNMEKSCWKIPADKLFRATQTFEAAWLSRKPVTEQRLADLSWWYVRKPLMAELHEKYRGAFNSSFPREPALPLDQEIVKKLHTLVAAKLLREIGADAFAKTLTVRHVSVRDARRPELIPR